MTEKETYEKVSGTILAVTNKAFLIDNEFREVWVPKSICSAGSRFLDELSVGDVVEVRIATWFCDKNDLP